ncbi:ABC transporter substrate-binding protein [Micromonospora sp. WMMD1102]|uniref:ABC transporter substrate-binding protein n=1 Tax=Micromonospora sp. WMMD1102 TaxID=3016105 RepID=UPI002414D59C|nr:ABC transporter substrate-binding protein [Micromonospora sp. WMMD1102]MDG4784603.1 ABC transporter substrate-binding protein [Micromonospora sp. WMMD1102]
MRPRLAVAATSAALMIAASALAACSENTGENGDSDDGGGKQFSSSIATDPKDSQGPAAEVPGAKPGGTLKLIQEADFEHLDPQRTYTFQGMSIQQMFLRTLTVFKEDGKGNVLLVGDLATDAGKDVNKDCKTWEYTLKEGVKFEDGTPITAADVSYGIARSYEESIDGGPTYIQEWLADSPTYNANYKGPYTSGVEAVPGLNVRGDRTLTFEFAKPHCDLPYALSLPTSVPVPRAKDTRTEYDRRVVSSGPYKIKEYVKDTRFVLERNPNWDPKTDPLRHAYPDAIEVEIGPNDTAATERALAGQGADQFAVAWDEVPQALVNQVLGDSSLGERVVRKTAPSVWYLSINNDRIKDVKVRQAIAYAIDRQGILATQGGDAAGKLTHTLLADTTIGRTEYPNPYDGGPTGNPEKAKELLGGQKPKLVFMSRATAFGQQTAPIVEQSLERAGFDVTVQYVEDHNPTARTRGNPYDIYLSNWAADWPSAVSTIPVLWDGRKLGPQGNSNVSYFNADDVNAEIDRVSNLPAGEAGPEWAKIDQMIMEKYVPVVPIYQDNTFLVTGAKVGGLIVSEQFGTPVFYNSHIKP